MRSNQLSYLAKRFVKWHILPEPYRKIPDLNEAANIITFLFHFKYFLHFPLVIIPYTEPFLSYVYKELPGISILQGMRLFLVFFIL
jgi:hypothetical protein